MSIQKKIALITGAGKGIGLAISNGLANSGYQTVLISRNTADLQNAAAEIIRNGGSAPLTFQMDITDTSKLSEIVHNIILKYGRIDVLVNNAGIYIDGTLQLSESELKLMIDTNLVAQFNLIKLVVPIMERQGSGYIFNIVSRSGKVGFAGSGGYCASKFGMLGLNESLHRELVPKRIRVTALCPGWVNTRMAFDAGTPLKEMEMIQPEDLFETVKWLLSLSAGACVKEVVMETPLNLE